MTGSVTADNVTFLLLMYSRDMKKELIMHAQNDGRVCSICHRPPFFTSCSGCGVPLCQECARFELYGHGCGTVMPLYYCRECAQDPHINPNAMLREPEP